MLGVDLSSGYLQNRSRSDPIQDYMLPIPGTYKNIWLFVLISSNSAYLYWSLVQLMS